MGGAGASFLFPLGRPAPARAAGPRRHPSVAPGARGEPEAALGPPAAAFSQ